MTLLNNSYVRWGIVGALLGVGFLEPRLWILGLVGVGCFVYLLIEVESSTKSKMFGAGLAWTIKYLCSLLWFWSAYPIDWLAVELGSIQLVLIFTYWFTASLWLGFGGVFVAGVSLFLEKFGSITKRQILIILPLLWVAGEIIGSLIFSLITFGPGSAITSAFSFGYVGYLLGAHGLLVQVARLGGVYLLTIVMVSFASVVIAHRSVRNFQMIVLCSLVFLYMSSFITLPYSDIQTENVHRVITIDTHFPVTELRTRESGPVGSALGEAVAAALAYEPDYIILPEDSRFFDQSSPVGTTKARFKLQFNDPQVVLIDSGRFDQSGVEGSVVQTYIYNSNEEVGRVQKRYLVPQGEYMPTLYASALSLLGYGHIVDRIGQSISFRVGNESDQSVLQDNVPGILFCFESVNPLGVRTILRERPNTPFIAHPISHAWFHESHQLWHQLDVMLRIQALWNQKFIISAGGHVSGKLYTPWGSIIDPQTLARGEYWEVRESYVPKQ